MSAAFPTLRPNESYEVHRTFEAYELGAQAVGLDARMVSFTGNWPAGSWRPPVAIRNVLNPWRVRASVAAVTKQGGWAILREFLTLPLLVATPALFRFRRRLLLVCAHNVQRGNRRVRDRVALDLLARAGFRFVVPETDRGIDGPGWRFFREAAIVLPLAVTDEQRRSVAGAKSERLVGVVGRPRVEKRADETVARVRAALAVAAPDARLLVGRPGIRPGALGESVETADTTEPADYREALARCSVVVLQYSKSDYEFRPSASILDAVAVRTAVVCPDFPVLRAQLTRPTTVGVCVDEGEDLAPALRRALALATAEPEPFSAWLAARAPEAIGARLARALRDVE